MSLGEFGEEEGHLLDWVSHIRTGMMQEHGRKVIGVQLTLMFCILLVGATVVTHIN